MAHDDDAALIRQWFCRLAEHMQAVDYVAARPLFAEDVIAFGSLAGFMTGRAALEAEQWRKVWGATNGFECRLTAAGMVVFDSTGYGEDGTPYDRPGRSTVVFTRNVVGADWVAQHVHFSLFPGVPPRSFGKKPSPVS
jgi:ketosteroid isomerase-like protein